MNFIIVQKTADAFRVIQGFNTLAEAKKYYLMQGDLQDDLVIIKISSKIYYNHGWHIVQDGAEYEQTVNEF